MPLTPTSTWIQPQNEAFTITKGTTQSFSADDLLSDDVGLNGSILRLNEISQPAHGTVTTLADGTFVYTPAANYVGSDSFNYTVTDQFNNLVTETVQVTVTEPVVPVTPAANVLPPVIVCLLDDAGAAQGKIDNGGNTDDTLPTLEGSGEPGTIVNIFDNGTKIGSVTVGANWQWTFTPTTPLGAGTHEFTVTGNRTDGTGSTPAQYSYSCVIGGGGNTNPVLDPVITSVNDDAGAITGVVSRNGTTDDTIPVLKGTGEPGTKVTIYDNGVAIGSATVGLDWQWSLTPTTALTTGAHTFTIVGSRLDGSGVTNGSTNYPINIGADAGGGNTSPVLDPVITSVIDDVGAITGTVVKNGTTDDTIPVLKGTGEPGTKVTISDNGVVIGTATVGADWQWTLTPSAPLATGAHTFTIVGSRLDGSGVTQGSTSYPITIGADAGGGGGGNTNPVLDPVITSVNDDVGTSQGVVTNGGTTDDTIPVLKGTGEPGTKVTIYDNGVLLGTATVGADWQWTLTPTAALPTGIHNFTIVGSRLDGSGVKQGPLTYTCDIETGSNVTPVLKPVITDAIDDVGPAQGQVANGGTTDDTLPAIKGTGEPGTKVAIYDNGVLLGETTVAPDWTWTFTPTTPLGNGAHAITAVGSRPDGSGSNAAPYPYNLNVATSTPVPPAAPTIEITEDANNDGTISATELNNRVDVKVTLPTSAKAGDTLTVTDQASNTVTRTLTAADITAGSVSLADAFPAPANGQVITVGARLTDAATGLSSATNTDAATMNTTPSGAGAPTVVITTDANNDGTINTAEFANRVDVQVTIPTGAKAGDLLTVSDDSGNVTGKVLTTADITAGRATFISAFPTPVDGQDITVQAKIITPTGVISPSGTDSARIDLTATSAPVVTITSDDDNDGKVSKAELTAHQAVDVKIDLPVDARAGDKLTVTDQTGAKVEKILTEADITAKAVTLDNAFPAPADGQPVKVTANVTDPAGNVSPDGTDSAVIHTTAPAITVTIVDDKNDNGTVTRPELAGATRVDVKIDLPAGVQAGDFIEVRDNAGNGVSKTLSSADITAGQVTFLDAFPLPASGATIAVAAKITDTAGNVSPVATDTAVFDGNYPPVAVDDTGNVQGFATPVVTLVAMNQDTGTAGPSGQAWSTADGDAGRAVYGQLSSLLTAGMKVQVASSDRPGTWIDAVVSSDGLHWTAVDNTTHTGSWTYTARIVDAAGTSTVSTSAPQLVTLSTAAPAAPVIDSFGTAAGDKSIALGAHTTDQTLVVNGHAAGGAASAGHTISVYANGTGNLMGTTVVKADGTWSLDLTGTSLANGGKSYNFYAKESDNSGTTSAWSNKAAVIVDTPNGVAETWADFGAATSWNYNGTGINKGTIQTADGLVNITTTSADKTYNGVYDLTSQMTANTGFSPLYGGAPTGDEAHMVMVNNGATMTITFDKPVTNPDLAFWNLYGNVTVTAKDAAGAAVTPALSIVDNTPGAGNALGGVANNQISNNSAAAGVIELPGTYTSITLTTTGGTSWYGLQIAQKPVTGTVLPADNGSIVPGAAGNVDHSGVETVSFATQAALDAAINAGIDGGGSIDTLKLSGTGMVLNLTTHSTTPGQDITVNNFEKFDLGAGGRNTLVMSVNDVLNGGNTNAFVNNGKTQVLVNGDTSDTLNLTHLLDNGGDTGNWALAGTQVVGGITYNVVNHSTLGAQVLVQQGVNVSLPAIGGSPAATTLFPTVEGNVLLNDNDQDGPVASLVVSGVSSSATTVQSGVGVETVIEGRYGHLTVHANGNYTYVADKSAGLVDPADDVFYYLNKDGGNADALAPAKLTIHVTPPYAQVVAVSSPTATEGQGLDFTITTSGSPMVTPITLTLANGTATVGTDTGTPLQVNFGNGWTNIVGNVVNAPAGTTSFQVRVPTTDDSTIEARETFTLTAKSGAVGGVTGTGSIVDNDLQGLNTQAVGTEDTPLVLKWNDFNLQNLPNASNSLKITSLPADGVLQYNNGTAWTPVTVNQSVTKADIDSGKLRFVPDTNESGIDGYNAPGVGNMKNDYAQAGFSATDTAGNQYNGSLAIDIKPVADGGDQTVTMTILSHNGAAPNPKPAFIGNEFYWDQFKFTVNGAASTDVDGSERLMVGLKNLVNTANQPERVFLANGTYVAPDANGIVWVKPTDTIFISGSQGLGGCNTSADYSLYRQEVNGQLTVLDQSVSASKHWTLTSPLVLDLNGDGVQTVGEDQGVNFDLDGDGQAVHTGWVTSQDGFLVVDRDGNGQIDSGREMFGQATQLADGTTAQDGFQALASMDSNHDGKISASDASFAKLEVWQDANSDGVTQNGELHSLAQLGITELSLESAASDAVQNGNLLGLTGSFTTADGVSHDMADVWFGNSGTVNAGLDASGHSLDQLLANAGLAEDKAAAPVAKPSASAHDTVHAAPVVPADMPATPNHDWAH